MLWAHWFWYTASPPSPSSSYSRSRLILIFKVQLTSLQRSAVDGEGRFVTAVATLLWEPRGLRGDMTPCSAPRRNAFRVQMALGSRLHQEGPRRPLTAAPCSRGLPEATAGPWWRRGHRGESTQPPKHHSPCILRPVKLKIDPSPSPRFPASSRHDPSVANARRDQCAIVLTSVCIP